MRAYPGILALLASFTAFALSVRAQFAKPHRMHDPAFLDLRWESVYDHGILGHDSLAAVAIDQEGNAYTVGSSLGFTGTYTYEIVTLKYAADGALLWERRFDSPGSGFNDIAVDVAVARDGDVVVLGQGPGSNGDQDVVLLRYDTQGTLRWERRWDNHWSDGATALAVAEDGSIYVLGGTYFPATVSDIALLKFDQGGSLLWSRFYHGGHGTDVGVGLAIDSAGDVLVAGYSISAPGGTNFDWVALKYDPRGILQWSVRRGGSLGWPDYCWGMHLDGNDDLVLTGFMVNSSGNQDFSTAKVDSTGTWSWTRSLGTATGAGYYAASDASGNIFIAGQSRLLSYDAAGNLRWQRTIDGPAGSAPSAGALAIDPHGRLLVSGSFLTTTAKTEIFTAAYAPAAGDPIDMAIYGGLDYDSVEDMALGRGGEIYVVGARPNGHDQDGVVLRYALRH